VDRKMLRLSQPESNARFGRRTGARLWAWLLSNAGRVFEVVATDLLMWEADQTPRRPRQRVDVDVRRVGKHGPQDWRALVPPIERRNLPAFLARADTGYLATVDGQFAGWVWRSTRSHRDPYSGLHIRLAPDEAYAYALLVPPEQRPNGVAAVLMVRMLSEVADDPALTRVYGWVDKRNRTSQILLRMLGFTQAQEVRRAHLLQRCGVPVPGTTRPAFGPLSRNGRHNVDS
jgi:hypothetical protein